MVKNYRKHRFYPKYKRFKALIRLLFNSVSFNIVRRVYIHGCHFQKVVDFLKDYRLFWKEENPQFECNTGRIYACLHDKTESTPVEPVYFYQNAWFVGRVVANKPRRHVDIASHLPSVGILSEIVPVDFVDIRTIPIHLPHLRFVQGDIVKLPYADGSIESLSSVCVIEHIGLGRFGDTIDAYGTEKAAKELLRVLAPGGHLYITVPVDEINRVYFNAHRAFTPQYIKALFPSCKIIQEQYLYGYTVQDAYEASKGYGTGMYHFCKN